MRTDSPGSRHFTNVQALRGIACLMVVLVHAWSMEKQFGVQTPVFREIQWFGFAGVDLFFVISGFIIAATNRGKPGSVANVPGFLFRRGWRIYPLYWIAMAASVVVGDAVYAPVWPKDSWPAWLALLPGERDNFVLGQAWSLVYEVMFYIAFAAALCLPARLRPAMFAIWGAVVAVSAIWPPPASPWLRHVLSPFVLEFLGGCFIARLAASGMHRFGWAALGAGIAYAVVAMLVLHASTTEPWGIALHPQRPRVLVFGPASVLIVYGFVSLEGRLRLPRRLHQAGDASYSLYLLHGLPLTGALVLGFQIPHTRLPHLLWLAGALGACLAAGLLTHRFVEKPLMNLMRVKKPKPAAISEPHRMAA